MTHKTMEKTASATDMDEKKYILRFELLGAFECEGHAIPQKTGKKSLSFLQYFIVNHTRSISSEELIGQFWGESRDPASALRNMLFKTRNLLRDTGGGCDRLLPRRSGHYPPGNRKSYGDR